MNDAKPMLLVDADNTLWDTDAVYAAAQVNLLAEVEEQTGLTAPGPKLDFVRAYDQALAASDHRGFRYPSNLLVRSLVLGLRGLPPKGAADTAPDGIGRTLSPGIMGDLTNRFDQSLNRTPELLPTVEDGLRLAAEAGADVWVLTENGAELQRSRVSHHGLDVWIRGVAEATKTVDQFARQRRRFAPRPLIVIGDQPDRDIAPAREAGCVAVLVPSRFRPPSRTHANESDHVASTFEDAVIWSVDRDVGAKCTDVSSSLESSD